MAGIMVVINIVAVFANYGKTEVSGFAVVCLIASIFAFGIFSNFRGDPTSAPSYAVLLSTLSGIGGVVFLVIGLAA